MDVQVRKWGNSIGLRIPYQIAEQLGIEELSKFHRVRFGFSEQSLQILAIIHVTPFELISVWAACKIRDRTVN